MVALIWFPYLFIHNISLYSLLYPFENPSKLFKNHFSTHWVLCANWDQSKLSTFWRNFPQRLQLVLYFLALATVPDVFEVEYRTIFFFYFPPIYNIYLYQYVDIYVQNYMFTDINIPPIAGEVSTSWTNIGTCLYLYQNCGIFIIRNLYTIRIYVCRSMQHIGKSYMHTHTYMIFPKNISKNERHRHIHSYISFVFYTIYF